MHTHPGNSQVLSGLDKSDKGALCLHGQEGSFGGLGSSGGGLGLLGTADDVLNQTGLREAQGRGDARSGFFKHTLTCVKC